MATKKRKVDMRQVDPIDRAYVQNIIRGVMNFPGLTAELDVQIWPLDDTYNVAFSGWAQEIDDETWYLMFLKKSGHDKRDIKYDYVQSTSTTPLPGGKDNVNVGEVKLFRIARGVIKRNTKSRK